MINILDCTLRDGGYVNDFEFGKREICSIIRKISESKIDIIECGFLKSGAEDKNRSLFSSVEAITPYLGKKNPSLMYVAMIAYGDISDEEISERSEDGIDGIRLTFHNHQIDEAVILGKKLMKKGYKVFMQPVGTISYTDMELLALIEKINEMNPFAFYIVDTMGTIYKSKLMGLFYMADSNLNPSIYIGYHSHNNLQLAFSNAQALIDMPTKRNIIIDSSVFGMGRGAGNLCTELITQYINENVEERYDIIPVLEIMDDYIMPIFAHYTWGYSAPYYLAAVHRCHPNYAAYLMNKQTLTMRQINDILKELPSDIKHLFSENLISDLYYSFRIGSGGESSGESLEKLSQKFKDRNILVLAPGKTLKTHGDKINSYIAENNPVIISVNAAPNGYKSDYIFFGNQKRLFAYEDDGKTEIIVTSNLSYSGINATAVDYSALCGKGCAEADNSGMMLLRLLAALNVKKAAIAGFDGYGQESMYYSEQGAQKLNSDISAQLKAIMNSLELDFLTPSCYV